ncbi:hypothetical protein B0H12DRAFT_1229014 [Mycena haematopus]|nr:hypothetical protein B0H12DRAFT_1229014 [Mycena haematopus]
MHPTRLALAIWFRDAGPVGWLMLLYRDQYRCVLTGRIDRASLDKTEQNPELFPDLAPLVAPQAPAVPGELVFDLEVAHIISQSLTDGIGGLSAAAAAKLDWASSASAILDRFSGIDIKRLLGGTDLHSAINGFMASNEAHALFDRLDFCLIPARDAQDEIIPNTYDVLYLHRRTIPPPSSVLLGLHAACARIAHMSGAAAILDDFDRDIPSTAVLTQGFSDMRADPVAAQELARALYRLANRPIVARFNLQARGNSNVTVLDSSAPASLRDGRTDVEQYEAFKTMGDADHQHAIAKVARHDSTADIKTVYTRVKGQKNVTTGLLEDGAICPVCTRKGVSGSASFLTGSVSSLRSHIAWCVYIFDLNRIVPPTTLEPLTFALMLPRAPNWVSTLFSRLHAWLTVMCFLELSMPGGRGIELKRLWGKTSFPARSEHPAHVPALCPHRKHPFPFARPLSSTERLRLVIVPACHDLVAHPPLSTLPVVS